MKNIFKTFSLCIMFFLSHELWAQNTSKKILENALNKTEDENQFEKNQKINLILKSILKEKNDTVKIKLYLKICDLCDVAENLKYSKPIINLIDNLLPLEKDSSKIGHLIEWRSMAIEISMLFYEEKNQTTEQEKILLKHLRIANLYKNPTTIINTRLILANIYFKNGEMFKKLACLQDGLEEMKKMKYYKGISRFLMQTAFFYADNKDTVAALEYIDKARENEKLINDNTRKNRGFILMGILYRDLGQYPEALNQFRQAIEGYTKLKDKEAIIDAYWNIGNTYQKNKNYNEAFKNFEIAEKMAQESENPTAIVRSMIAKGDIQALLGKYDQAIETHKWMWEKIIEFKEKIEVGVYIYVGSHLAKDYVLAKQYKNAKNIISKILPLSTVAIEKRELEELAFKADSAIGNYKEAFLHYYNFVGLHTKINDTEVAKVGAQQKFKNDYEKQKLVDKTEQDKKDALVTKEKQQQRIITFIIIFILILVAIFSVLLYVRFRLTNKQKDIISIQKSEVENQKHLVEEKQKEILDSIHYAKRLQDAILPPLSFINEHLPHNFVLYQPKDVVAGDFYWAEFKDNLFFIAAADCTGHGVPGAMVSVVCSNALNRTVNEFGITNTGNILDKTRELVMETFAKGNTEVKDGMDISLLCIDKNNNKAFWSGANNPLWYIDSDTSSEAEKLQLHELKTDKQPIGKTDYPKPFTTHVIDLKPGMLFYLFTDGFADQFGGPKGKKFKYKQLEELLLANAKKSMQVQQQFLLDNFSKWKGNLEQIDDVCVIGVKL